METVHVDIPPIKTFLSKKFLYDMDEAYAGQWERCKIFAASSYKTEALTAKVLICSNGAVFDYLPFHAFSQTQTEPELDITDLCFHSAPLWNITVSIHDELKKQSCWVWFKRLGKFIEGNYHCTIDWYEANTNLNLIQMSNGQIATVPNHKCLFGKQMPEKLPDYRALHPIWKI